ncbi:MAG: reactive intermediate/imine deaminase [Anaerolineae bacterium]|jgi:2-iminobutanoate/2-iminopropanoate deaminase|nr:reactive intermediate/imine deaminase [Anaerolineae bacterium]MBT7069816.1 reactive intermediate/imine deaminase [Anaerolineae bacterium]MBT7326691.1 reactive intermediate/imine deaminase [Anaerolineae bacterium]
MKIQNIEGAPAAIGPYAHAIQSGNLVFCSGQTPINPETMQLVGTTIEEQTERVLQNLNIVLSGLGLSLQNIVKTTVFLKSMDDFQGMNGVYARIFEGHTPSRSTIAIRQNPLDALVEIECIAEIST